MTIAQAVQTVANETCARRIDEVVIHHSWRPTSAQYRGEATIDAIRDYHVNTRGWSDIGYHWLVGPDGQVFQGRKMGRSGAHVLNRNAHTIGVCMIADFDAEDPQAWGGWDETLRLVRALLDRFKLPVGKIRFHREFQSKTCPGTRMDLTAFRELFIGARNVKVVLLPANQTIPCGATLDGDRVVVNAGPLRDALGLGAWTGDARAHIRSVVEPYYVVHPHLEQSKVYLRDE